MTTAALALLEFDSVPIGVLAADRMLKRSPVALLRCGTIHPGRYLVLVGGSVAATGEAHREGMRVGRDGTMLVDQVCLADPHPALVAAVAGERVGPTGDTVGVLEMRSSPALLAALDALLKAVPVGLVEAVLGDDLGGRAVALIDGELADVQEALAMTSSAERLQSASILPRVDDVLRDALTEGSRFTSCTLRRPPDGERLDG